MSHSQQAPTRKGREYALKAETALREGKSDEAKMWHKNASNAFREARDALLEGDASTRMALTILIDYHRDREKNPGDPKHVPLKPQAVAKHQLIEPSSVPLSPSSSSHSISEAWNAVHEFGDVVQSSVTPPPLPEASISLKSAAFNNSEWKKGTQSVMAESYYIVGGEAGGGQLTSTGGPILSRSTSKDPSLERLQSVNKALSSDLDKLAKENSQLRSMLLRERDEAKAQREKFWNMFVLVKAALEDAKVPVTTNLGSSASTSAVHESELKALTRLLHAETEARKKAEAELENLRRTFS